MDKIYELFETASSNKISKLKLKNQIKKFDKSFEKAIDWFKSVDKDKFFKVFSEKMNKKFLEIYREGKISAENVEFARRLSVINSNEIAQALYKMNKEVYELCQKLDEEDKKSNSAKINPEEE